MYTLPKLAYRYDALEPHIDARTMEIHHTKHHQAYLNKLNGLLEKHPEYKDDPVEKLLQSIDSIKMDEADKKVLCNHGGGYVNHSLFWTVMGPKKEVDQQLVSDIESAYHSVDEFKKEFTAAALGQFGSGWAWLVRTKEGKLAVYSMANQDSPYLKGDTPVFGIDVWEHAYYLHYQNKRADYVAAWWQVLKLLP